MNVLIVCSINRGRINPFIVEQVNALKHLGVNATYFTINKPGISGYFKNYLRLLQQINTHHYDLIHAHYGLSGLVATLQRKVPVIVTFHGSDVNVERNKKLSRIAKKLAKHSIVVDESFISKLRLHRHYSLMPCGVNLDTFYPIARNEARKELNWSSGDFKILFSSSFSNPVKNYKLAKDAVEMIPDTQLIELKGYSREQINLLMNAADGLLLTSFSEGSPQVVKEALACNLPVIATAVGDVPKLLMDVKNSWLTDFDPVIIAEKLLRLKLDRPRSDGRMRAIAYDNKIVTKNILDLYKQVTERNNFRLNKTPMQRRHETIS